MLLRGIGSNKTEAPVRPLGARCPNLLAVDPIVVAHVLASRLQGGQIRAGPGLGVALAPLNFAAADGRNVLQLLFFGAVFKQGRAEHHDAHSPDRVVGASARKFLVDNSGVGRRKPRTAVFGRPRRRPPALFADRLAPGDLFLGRLRALFKPDRIAQTLQVRREVDFDPGPHVLRVRLEIMDEWFCVADCRPSRTAATPRLGHQWRNLRPLFVRQVRRVTLGLPGDLGHPDTALLCPHPEPES